MFAKQHVKIITILTSYAQGLNNGQVNSQKRPNLAVKPYTSGYFNFKS